MNKIYIYLANRSKNGIKILSVMSCKENYSSTRVLNVADLGLESELEFNIQKQYNITSNDLTIGYHDVGSFSAKIKANEEGKLKSKQWEGFNNEGWTGGALLIPKTK